MLLVFGKRLGKSTYKGGGGKLRYLKLYRILIIGAYHGPQQPIEIPKRARWQLSRVSEVKCPSSHKTRRPVYKDIFWDHLESTKCVCQERERMNCIWAYLSSIQHKKQFDFFIVNLSWMTFNILIRGLLKLKFIPVSTRINIWDAYYFKGFVLNKWESMLVCDDSLSWV